MIRKNIFIFFEQLVAFLVFEMFQALPKPKSTTSAPKATQCFLEKNVSEVLKLTLRTTKISLYDALTTFCIRVMILSDSPKMFNFWLL